MAKLTVDLKNGLFEVEGDEALVREIYGDYKDALAVITSRMITASKEPVTAPQTLPTAEAPKQDAAPAPSARVAKPKSAVRTETYSLIDDLNLQPASGESLKDFYARMGPATAMEKNAVFVHYLERVLGVTGIGMDHLYTCYRDVGSKVPVALVQSLRDTAADKGWVNITDLNDLKLTVRGENFIAHELPRAKSPKAE